MIILVFVIALVLNAVSALKFSSIAEDKGHSGYFWWCFFLGIAGWMMVIALPDRHEKDLDEAQFQKIAEQLVKNSVSDSGSSEGNDTLPYL